MRPKPPATPRLPQSAVPGVLKPTVTKASEEVVEAPEPLPDLEFTRKAQSVPATTPSAVKPGAPKTRAEMELAMSEFDREFTVRFAELSDVDVIVTDPSAPPRMIAELERHGIEVIVA